MNFTLSRAYKAEKNARARSAKRVFPCTTRTEKNVSARIMQRVFEAKIRLWLRPCFLIFEKVIFVRRAKRRTVTIMLYEEGKFVAKSHMG